ncbi:MAG TPA: MFS transporter [Candidatus Limnocylindrales bacterium]|nr:MFS transporter [Candidatus Limnocylindrales bacterium]
MPASAVLSLYWFVSLIALGLFFPLFSLYLSENLGLSGKETGLVTAAIPLAGLLAQPLWGVLADRSGSRVRMLSLVTAGASIGYAHLAFERTFGSVLLATLLLAVFSTSVMPMSVSVSMALLRERGRHAFGIVRSAGTLGYLVAVAGFPAALHAFGALVPPAESAASHASEPHLGLMLFAACAAMGTASLISLALPRGGAVSLRAASGDWRLLFAGGPYPRLLAVTLVTYVFLQGPLVMFPLYVRSLGGGLDVVSHMWIWMLAFEIPLLAGVAAAPSWIGARELIGIGIAADATRWLVCASAHSLDAIYYVQVLHGVAVAGFVVGSALYVEAVVPGKLRSTAQGLVYMIGVGIGGVVSSAAAGALVDAYGPRAPALVGGLGGAMLAIALPWVLPKVSRHSHDDLVAIEAIDERPTA